MAIIQSGLTTDLMTVDPTSKAARVTQYNSSGTELTPLAEGGTVNTELPAAVALADATANPTVPGVGAFLIAWSGTVWDRVKQFGTGLLGINLRNVAGTEIATAANPLRTDPTGTTTQPVSIAATVQVDVTDEPTRDLGKVDVSSLDQYTPVSGRLPVDGSGVTQPISAATLPLPTGAATSALQTQPGVDIGDVTINNAGGASAVNIQDGGNSITVDGTFFQATQPVSGNVTADTELPTAAALADGTANPTVPLVGACLEGYNGTTFDRLRAVTTEQDGLIGSLGALLINSVNREFNVGGSYDRIRHSFTQTTTGIVANGAGTAVNMITTPMSNMMLQVVRTVGATDVVSIELQGSLDGTNWSTLNIVTTVVGGVGYTNIGLAAFTYMRYNVVTVGAGNTLTIMLLATR